MYIYICVCVCVCVCVSTRGSPPEIRTPKHRNLIARIMTALPPVLSPNNILAPPTLYCPFILTRGTPTGLAKSLYLKKFYSFKDVMF